MKAKLAQQSVRTPARGRQKPPVIRIGQKPTYKKIADDIDLYGLFVKIEERFETCILLESLGEHSAQGRYSVIGFDPKYVIRARGQTLFVDDTPYDVPNPYNALRELMPQKTLARHYAGGLTGYIGYDAVNYMESSLSVKAHPDFDAFMFGAYTDGLVMDTQTGELFYFYCDEDRSAVVEELLAAKSGPKTATITPLGRTRSKAEHAAAVEAVKERIRAGDIFQCEVGFKSQYRLTGDALCVYEKLREVNPSPYTYYMKFGDKKLLGASPELLFELQAGAMATHPLAGTIRRGKDEAEDRRLARQLLNDPKEIAEHNMLVDLHRNDIGRVAQFGSVRVRDLRSIKRFSHVQHISSEIVGSLKNGEDMFSALAANFPAGTLTGAPKIEAMKIIDAHEPLPRGPYGGAVGHFGFNGDCTFAIAIRSLFVSGESAYAQTSGGIVYDSVPAAEYEEIERKLAATEKAVSL